MKVSIILPVWNLIELTKRTIENFFEKTKYGDYILTIVDNGSTDGTREYLEGLEKENTRIELILNNTNVRGNIAWNQAIERTYSAKYFCFIQNDVLFTDRWLTKLMGIMEVTSSLGVISPFVLDPNSFKHEKFYSEVDRIMEEKDCESTTGFHGCTYLVRRSVYDKLKEVYGYWIDERFFLLWSDLDFIERVEHVGFETRIVGNPIIYHYGAKTQELFSEAERNRYYSSDEAYFWTKWYKPTKTYIIKGGRIRYPDGRGMRLKQK